MVAYVITCITPFHISLSSVIRSPFHRYHDFSEIGLPHVFPFHSVCYEGLRRCISLKQPGDEIRGDALYRVFEEANGGRYVRLQLDYGDPDPPAEQVWEIFRGQEVGGTLRAMRLKL
jgi:hypothetical protein